MLPCGSPLTVIYNLRIRLDFHCHRFVWVLMYSCVVAAASKKKGLPVLVSLCNYQSMVHLLH